MGDAGRRIQAPHVGIVFDQGPGTGDRVPQRVRGPGMEGTA